MGGGWQVDGAEDEDADAEDELHAALYADTEDAAEKAPAAEGDAAGGDGVLRLGTAAGGAGLQKVRAGTHPPPARASSSTRAAK